MGFPIQIYQPGFKEGWPIAETSVGSHVIPILSYSKSGWWFHPLWKIWRIVSWDDDIPNIWKIKHVPNHQAANCLLVTFLDLLVWGPKVQHILNRFPSHGGLTNRKDKSSTEPIQVNPNLHCLNAHISSVFPIVPTIPHSCHGCQWFPWRHSMAFFPTKTPPWAATFDAGAAAAQSAQCNPPISRSPVKADHLCSSLAISVTCPGISQCSIFFGSSWLMAFWWFWGYVRTDCCSNQSKLYISSTLNWASACWTNKKRSFSQVSTSWSRICPSFSKASTFISLARPGFSRPRVWSSKIWVCLKMRCAQKRWFQPGKCYPVLGQTHMGWTSS